MEEEEEEEEKEVVVEVEVVECGGCECVELKGEEESLHGGWR